MNPAYRIFEDKENANSEIRGDCHHLSQAKDCVRELRRFFPTSTFTIVDMKTKLVIND